MGEELITVRKLAYDEQETWHWSGQVVERGVNLKVIDALFNARSRDLGYMKLETGDLFHEFYYSDRWFNIFQVFGSEGAMKGWYCNICKPARFSDGEITFVDMVLDVFVYPDGRTLVLDEEEFRQNAAALYSQEDARRSQEAIPQLLEMVRLRERPFDSLDGETR